MTANKTLRKQITESLVALDNMDDTSLAFKAESNRAIELINQRKEHYRKLIEHLQYDIATDDGLIEVLKRKI